MFYVSGSSFKAQDAHIWEANNMKIVIYDMQVNFCIINIKIYLAWSLKLFVGKAVY